MKNKFRKWTAQEETILREMKAARFTERQIAIRLGRIQRNVSDRWRWINMSAADRAVKQLRSNEVRRQKRSKAGKAPRLINRCTKTVERAPPEILIEREKRLAAPHTLSGMLMGDPPIGFSALDRRQQGIFDAPYVDHSQAQLRRNRPTLAWQPILFS